MTTTAKIPMLILHEEEVRKAARLITAARALLDASPDDGQPLGKETAKAIFAAFDACAIALHGADEENVILMLSASQLLKPIDAKQAT